MATNTSNVASNVDYDKTGVIGRNVKQAIFNDSSINQIKKTSRKANGQLYVDLINAVRANWTGADADKFIDVINDAADSIDKYIDLMQRINTAIAEDSTKFQSNVNANTQRF